MRHRSSMELYTPVKTMLLFYLSLAVLFPSYQGFENGQEFHFFEIFESYAEYSHHNQSGIEASYDHEHPHSLILFYPSSQFRQKYQISYIAKFFSSRSINIRFTITEYSNINSLPGLLHTIHIYGHKTSGLSPPAQNPIFERGVTKEAC